MSSAYSNSPTLRLPIADSPLRRRASLFVAVLALGALWYGAERGYPLLALALAPVVAWICWGLRRAPWHGAALSWRQGEWQLCARGQPRRVELLPGAVTLPWLALVPLRYCAGGSRHYLWIFADSVSPAQWRLLRVRLRLPDPGRGAR